MSIIQGFIAGVVNTVRYEIVPNDTNINEGSTVVYTITTGGVADGTTVYWQNTGTTSAADLSNAISGNVTISGGTATLSLTATADKTTEGSETIVVSLYKDSGLTQQVATAATVTVSDTSLTPTYVLSTAGAVTSVNEGTALTFNVSTTFVDNGTTLYWVVGSTGSYSLVPGRFSPGTSGSFTVTGGAGTFTVTVSADTTTATGTQSYNIQLSTTNSPPTLVGNTVGITVNDTSMSPTTHSSVNFNGSTQWFDVGTPPVTSTVTMQSGNANIGAPPYTAGSYAYFTNNAESIAIGSTFTADGQTCTVAETNKAADKLVFVGFTPRITEGVLQPGDTVTFNTPQPWYLGNTWTVEFWSKARTASTGKIFAIACQTPGATALDMFYVSGKLRIINDGFDVCNEPTPGEWTHVAIVSDSGTVTVYYNGALQYSGVRNINLTNSTDRLVIGRRGSGNYQYFDGKITNMRITNTAVYNSTFVSTVLPLKITGTKLLWTPTNYSITTDSSDLALPMSNNNSMVYDTDYPYESAYEAIRAGGAPLTMTKSINGLNVQAAATNFNGSPAAGSYISIDGTTVASDSSIGVGQLMTRGHTMVVVNKETNTIQSIQSYDTYASPSIMESALYNVTVGRIVILVTWDATSCTANMRSILVNQYGATDNTSTWTTIRYSHLFIGVKR